MLVNSTRLMALWLDSIMSDMSLEKAKIPLNSLSTYNAGHPLAIYTQDYGLHDV